MGRRLKHNIFDVGTSDHSLGQVSWSAGADSITLDTPRRQSSSVRADTGIRSGMVALWFAILFFGLSTLTVRAAYLQVIQGSDLRAVAEGNRLRIQDIKAKRGVIYDRYHQQLVENVPGFSLALIPIDVPKAGVEREALFGRVSALSGKTSAEIAQVLEERKAYPYQPAIIMEQLPYDQAILAMVAAGDFPAIRVLTESIRQYGAAPLGTAGSLSHLLGYPSRIHADEVEELLARNYSLDDFIGRAGLEQIYEEELKGQNGKEAIEVDATGKPKTLVDRQEAIDGQNIVLSLDAGLQQYAEQRLRDELGKVHKTRGSVIALDPRNGEILALVSLPAYDNNLFARGIPADIFNALRDDPNQPLFGRAVSGEYPPGSTFKLIVGAAGLEEGVITPDTTVLSNGGIRIGQWYFPDWKGGGHGVTNLSKAIAESVNTFFYMIGGGYGQVSGLGMDRLSAYAKKFGLGAPMGIDLPHEGKGFVPTIAWKEEVKDEPWYIGDTYHAAIGQGDMLVTPLQVAGWTMFFANGGTVYTPHLARMFVDGNNEPIKKVEPTPVIRNIISPQNVEAVRVGMREAVLAGSARRLGSLPISSAGKTGTAQWSSKEATHAWTTAFAPFEQPQIVVTVMVEAGGEGSSVAIPIVADVLQWWSTHRYAGAVPVE
jgi:penicillin-binding protein 2